MSVATRKALVLVVEDPSDVRVGDDVYLFSGDTVTRYGRVIGFTGEPDRPFVFDEGFMPVISDSSDDWRFACAIRVVDASLHPAGGDL